MLLRNKHYVDCLTHPDCLLLYTSCLPIALHTLPACRSTHVPCLPVALHTLACLSLYTPFLPIALHTLPIPSDTHACLSLHNLTAYLTTSPACLRPTHCLCPYTHPACLSPHTPYLLPLTLLHPTYCLSPHTSCLLLVIPLQHPVYCLYGSPLHTV